MSKIEEARTLLKALSVPTQQQADLCCYTLLAMADIKENSSWTDATNDWIRIHDLLLFLRKHYQVVYAVNSRDTFRKQALHPLRNAAFIEDNGKATNSPNYRYRLTEEMLDLIKSYGTDAWADKKEKFLAAHEM